jgi:hypothetical protein
MDEPHVQRTLVKSPPELWAEISDDDALARHLGGFGEIRITRREDETTVAWEGDRGRGTVELEPSGWGTKVTLTAQVADAPPAAAPAGEAAREPGDAARHAVDAAGDAVDAAPGSTAAHQPHAESAPDRAGPPPRVGFFARLFRRRARPAPPPESAKASAPRAQAPPAPTPPAPPAAPSPVVAPIDPGAARAILTAVLDDLGSAHHRPFSR